MCVGYAIFEVGSTIYDLGDLAVTAVGYARGTVSGRELSVTVAGTGAGLLGVGGGLGRTARNLARAEGPAGVTSCAARRTAMRQQGIPTSRAANRQIRPRQAPQDRQYQYDAPNGRVNTVTHHSPDANHPNPHWEAGTAKHPERTDPLGRARYGSDKAKVEYNEP